MSPSFAVWRLATIFKVNATTAVVCHDFSFCSLFVYLSDSLLPVSFRWVFSSIWKEPRLLSCKLFCLHANICKKVMLLYGAETTANFRKHTPSVTETNGKKYSRWRHENKTFTIQNWPLENGIFRGNFTQEPRSLATSLFHSFYSFLSWFLCWLLSGFGAASLRQSLSKVPGAHFSMRGERGADLSQACCWVAVEKRKRLICSLNRPGDSTSSSISQKLDHIFLRSGTPLPYVS